MNLRRNALANLVGGALPAIIMLATMPIIVGRLGAVDFGILTVITSLIGYFALLDINVTSGGVKYLAEYQALGERNKISAVVTFGTAIYAMIGIVGALLLALNPAWLVARLFPLADDQNARIAEVILIAAPAFFFGQIQSNLNSIPQALQRYDISARIETVFGTVIPIATVGLLLSGGGLVQVIVLRTVASALNVIILMTVVRYLLPDLRIVWPDKALRSQLLSFSGYAYLSRIAAVTYAHADKLIIGGMLGMTAVTYYSVAATLINRAMSLTFRLSAVVYPAASRLLALNEHERLRRVYLRGSRYISYLNACFVALAILLADEILHYWMGAAFAREGAWVLRLVAMAMLLDSFTNLPSLVNDGAGKPRVTGGFALTRAIIGLLITWQAALLAGIVGVAAGHMIASLVMGCAFLAYVHGRTVPVAWKELFSYAQWPSLLPVLIVIGAVLAAKPTGAMPIEASVGIGIVVAALLAGVGLLRIVERDDLARLPPPLCRLTAFR